MDPNAPNAGYVTWHSYFIETFIRAASPRVVGVDNPFTPFAHHDTITDRLIQLEQHSDRDLATVLIDVATTIQRTACVSQTQP